MVFVDWSRPCAPPGSRTMISRTSPYVSRDPAASPPVWKRLLVVAAVLLASSAGFQARGAENDAQTLMETVGKAVVTIKTSGGKMGSGFIVDPDTVVTNFHVIA